MADCDIAKLSKDDQPTQALSAILEKDFPLEMTNKT